MDYDVGHVGRMIVARGFDGEDVYAGIESVAAKENVRSAVVIIVGGLRKGRVVVGPVSPDGRPEPQYVEFDDAREIVGVGTIFMDAETDRPSLHLHAGIGRGGQEPIVGCPRGGATVFCVLEAILIEIKGVEADRRIDPETAFKLLTLARGRR